MAPLVTITVSEPLRSGGAAPEDPLMLTTPSLARNSMARLAADICGLVLGLIVSIITARWLEPSGKGLLSTAAFLSSIAVQISLLGLGEAAIVRIGQRKSSMQTALSASLVALIPAALLGICFYWGAAYSVFQADWGAIRTAVVFCSATIPVMLLYQLATAMQNSSEQFVASSATFVVNSAVATIATLLLVVAYGGAVSGAAAAMSMGALSSVLLTVTFLRRMGLRFRLRIDRDYLRWALSYGPRLQAAQLLVTIGVRFDMLLVYLLSGAAAAGQYSVALTASGLGGMLPLAVIVPAFPRLARLTQPEADALTARVNRFVLAACLGSSAVIAAALPVVLPLAFGPAFRPAVVPSIILLAGGVLGTSQYHLARAKAASGDSGLLFSSFGISSIVMVGLDILLIPYFGLTGAASGCAAAYCAGFLWCCRDWRSRKHSVRALLPCTADFREAVKLLTSVVRRPPPITAGAKAS